ncbi:hypothetical protein HOK51_05710 [Candidatus Woesearchaeota archaeon]|jgi:hypothetical protein|nr:hypothetical protein [Candidatus Woesearchaeota archaeon]MBT6519325.1 hypothetical protein [Candidatus Woesearchaeota archaeon]MBT7366785.1 hypothetical protein [Candidatus Woesearchaeota archaeon]
MPSIDLLVEHAQVPTIFAQYRIEVIGTGKNKTAHLYHRDTIYRKHDSDDGFHNLNSDKKIELLKKYSVRDFYKLLKIMTRSYNFTATGQLEHMMIVDGDFTDSDFRWNKAEKIVNQYGNQSEHRFKLSAYVDAKKVYDELTELQKNAKLVKKKEGFDLYISALKPVINVGKTILENERSKRKLYSQRKKLLL